MPVPASMQDLSKTASSNSPAGSEAIGTSLDNYIRGVSAILRQTYSLASAPIAAASTIDVAAADGESVEITGSATINSLGTGYVGCVRELRFAGVCAVVHSNNIVLQRGNSITTGAGDVLVFRCTAAGQWKQVSNSDAINTTQLNQAIEDALGSGGNYDVTPRQWTFQGNGTDADIPIPGADVPDPNYYFVAMEEVAASGLFGVQRPFADYTVVIDPVDPLNSVLRFNSAPPNLVLGDIRLLGYARPYLGPPPTVAAPWTVLPLPGDSLTVDHTHHNTLVVTEANVPVTITVREDTGDPDLDWQDGDFFGVLQLGTGQVEVVGQGGVALSVPLNFEPYTRAQGATIVSTCIGVDQHSLGGDLLRTAVAPAKLTHRMADRSVLSNSAITTTGVKDALWLPYDFQLDTVADGGLFAYVNTVSTTSGLMTVDIRVGGTSILQTLMTIDHNEKSSRDAATQPVYSAAFLAANRVIPANSEITLHVTATNTASRILGVSLTGVRAS